MQQEALTRALEKGGLTPAELDYVLAGDLLNQCIGTAFGLRDFQIPFFGLYGACSTMSESICLGGMLLDGEHATQVVCAASSHFCTAERQYRFPLEFGAQRPPTAQWTVTGAGAGGSTVTTTTTGTNSTVTGTGAGGGTGTCGVNASGNISQTVSGQTINVPVNLNVCVTGIAAGSCSASNAQLNQTLAGQQGLTGVINLNYTYSASCAAGAINVALL